jgi:hypothetical protein
LPLLRIAIAADGSAGPRSRVARAGMCNHRSSV